MIGKILYKAKIRDNEIVIESHTIVTTERKYHYFGGKLCWLKSDVGVVCFLTKKEAIDHLIKELEHFVEMGDQYIKRTKQQLKKAKMIYQKNDF